MDISSLNPAQQRALLEELKKGNLGGVTGKLGLELAGLLGQGTRAYTSATEPLVRGAQDLVYKNFPSKVGGISPFGARMAGHGAFRGLVRSAPILGAVGGVMGAADVIAGPDSLANKAMDTAAMTGGAWKGAAAGAAAGSIVPGLGTAAGAIVGGLSGAGIGKMGSDGLQWLFGDKKSAEQRRLEEALIALRGGVV